MENGNGAPKDVLPVSGMYENWFLDYASYVILERAVPSIVDGFKPVQRRIMHAMKEMDDGRYNKVANVIGSTMQYHPHGDASIGDAMVNIGQKDLLIDTQGNWGDVRTGDGAAAPRYIEGRLSKFALEVLFNPKTTDWQLSYDGRKNEPVHLPVKFPLLLAQGGEGIAVGLSTKIMPHNFIELVEASIKHLKGESFELYPDFPTGGYMDASNYNEGLRGGKLKVRAKIESPDNKRLLIKELPATTTTQSLIDSIIKANDSGKIKIKKVIDNTAKDVEIEVMLASGQSPHVTIDALYAFTDCEVSISPNCCVIIEDKPAFMSVHDILKVCTDNTKELLKRELEIKKAELLEKLLFSSLEKIFIENRIYRDIEECETWEDVLLTIDKGLDPYKKDFYREITEEDIIRLTEIKIKRISKFDTFKADELMKNLQDELATVERHLKHLVQFAVDYYANLLKKYGKDKERKTELREFETITAAKVAANNAKLYVNKKEGFIGYGLKKDEFVSECSDLDDIIVFRKDGNFLVTKISDKVFVGKNIMHTEVFLKTDERKVFNLLYTDGKSGVTRAKRFQVNAITRDKEYDLTLGTKGTKILYFSSNPNGEAEVLGITLSPTCKARNKAMEFDFASIDIKGRGSQGNIVTKHPVRSTKLKKEGVSTLGALDIWYDPSVRRLNKDKNGEYLGKFNEEDRIIVVYENGNYELTNFELSNRYDESAVVYIDKFKPENPISLIYRDGKSLQLYVKRFTIETVSMNKKFNLITEHKESKALFATSSKRPTVTVNSKDEVSGYNLDEITEVKGWKAIGNKLPFNDFKTIRLATVASNASDEDSDAQLELF